MAITRLAAVLLLLGAASAKATTLEVGSGKAYATIQAAVDVAVAGDTVLIYSGTYTGSNTVSTTCGGGNYFGGDAAKTTTVCLKSDGASDNRITLRAAAGQTVIIDGESTTNFNIYSVSQPYWTIDGITLKDATQTAIYSLGASAAGAEIKNCSFTGTASYPTDHGIDIAGNGTTITDNSFDLPTIFVSIDVVNSTNSIISGNQIDGGDYGIYLHGGTAGSTVSKNTISNLNNCGVLFRDSNNVVIRNNLIVSPGTYGIYYQDESKVSSGCVIYNNTIVNASSTAIFEGDVWATTTNNITYNGTTGIAGIQDTNLPAGQPKTNLIYGATYSYYDQADAGGINITTLGTGNIISDPLFVGSGSYALTASSPAKDTGTTIVAFSDDILGASRPFGAAWDMGAYEYGASPPAGGSSGMTLGNGGSMTLGSGGTITLQ